MNRTTLKWIAAAALCAAPGCQLPGHGAGESYTLQGDPWAPKPVATDAKAGGGEGAKPGNAASGSAQAAAPSAGKDGKAPAEGFTVLEQLEAARARIKALEAENAQLKTDSASLSTLCEQLKQQNQNLAQLADANVQSRATLDQEMEKVRQEAKGFEARCHQLADDLLTERIQRVRVERELILAKVKEAEGKDEGR